MEYLVVIAVIFIGYLLLKSRSSGDTDSLPQEFIVFDIETTGLNAQRNEILEIAAIKVNKGTTNHAVFESLVIPKGKITQKITKINGITHELVEREGRELEPVLREFLDFIGDLRLVAFNAKFDLSFIKEAAGKYDLEINNEVFCALEMAKRAWPGLKSYKLTELAKKGGVSTEGAHRALKDAELTITVYSTAVSILGEVA